MLMTDREIKEAINNEEIIMNNFAEECLQPSSYDMRVGQKAILSGRDLEINIQKQGGIIIKPGQFAILTTYENIKMPPDITGHIGVKSYFTRKGLILLSGLQIDPGFEGVLVLGVYNAAPRKLTLDFLSPFCTIEFHRLSSPVEKPYSYSNEQKTGEIPRIDKDYLRTIETQSLSDISENLRELTVNVSNLTKLLYTIIIPLIAGTFLAVVASAIAKIL